MIFLRSSGVKDKVRRSGVNDRCFFKFRWKLLLLLLLLRPPSWSMSLSGVNERCFFIELVEEASDGCGTQ